MNARAKKILPLLLFCLSLTACAGQEFDDSELLRQAREAAAAEASSIHTWGAKPKRVRAAITPESMALFPSMRGDMALLGVYGNYPDGDTRFALTMPQGTRIGSCTRPAGGKPVFQSMSSLAVIGDLVRASFSALDEFFACMPGDGESWRLQKGDVRGGVGREQTVLLRRRGLGWGSYANFVYDLAGRPLVFYQVGNQAVDWKLTFRNTGEKPSYVFIDYRYDWIINVEIMEVTP